MNIVTVKKRDKERTKGKILSAVGEIIEEHGIEKVGINLVARTAGVNKVLVYRYFETIDGLIQEYIKKAGLHVFDSDGQAINHDDSKLQARPKDLIDLMLSILHDLRNNKQMRNVLRWEMQSGKSILPNTPNQEAESILRTLGNNVGNQDVEALFAILTAGIYYLVIVSDYQDKIIDIDLHSERGWKRIEITIKKIIEGAVF